MIPTVGSKFQVVREYEYIFSPRNYPTVRNSTYPTYIPQVSIVSMTSGYQWYVSFLFLCFYVSSTIEK